MCRYTDVLLTLLFVYHQSLLPGGDCYFPDQSITWEPYVPCDTEVVCTAPTVMLAINAHPMATITVVPDTFIEAGVQTSLGNRRTALQNVNVLRDQLNPEKSFCFP